MSLHNADQNVELDPCARGFMILFQSRSATVMLLGENDICAKDILELKTTLEFKFRI